MTWHVQSRKDVADLIVRHQTPEQAIETACNLLDLGFEVTGIGQGPLTNSVGREHIDRIYALWTRERHPFA